MINILLMVCTLGIFHTPSYETMVNNIHNSSDLAYYFTYFDYKKDKTKLDNWKTPREMYDAGGDDCEGFAVFGYETLIDDGYECIIYSIDKDSETVAHAIFVYYKEGDSGYFSNYRREKGYFSIGEILRIEGYDNWDPVEWKERRKLYHKLYK